MGPQPPVPASAPRYDKATSAKELFDMIGETVQKKVQGATRKYYAELHGDLTKAKFDRSQSGQQTENDPCNLDYRYHTDVKNSGEKEYPCKSRSDVRFSDTQGAECKKSKIKDSNVKEGACAPLRRLHICDYNLENINDYKNITNDTLLVDVCLAAKYEGTSIRDDYVKYQAKNKDFNTTICTELARSFADIGDIVRGRDLYRRDKGEETKLEQKLKDIFTQIHDNLKDKEAKDRYKEDPNKNYYQLREDWWEANRETIWRALTCHAPNSAHYTKSGADGSIKKSIWTKCRDVSGVPTNFDYVPQYLRWLHEWAEDFCRKKKKYVNIVKKFCREGENGKIYCSGDGFDCTKTIRAIGKYAISNECNKCSVWCGFYKKWLANQKQEFLKQKKKCENEISGNSRHKRSAIIKDYKAYDEEFYEILESGEVGGLNKFLDLLSNEEVCKKINTQEEGKIDFKNVDGSGGGNDVVAASAARGKGASADSNSNRTFYHSDYCEPCPECGVKEGTFEVKTKNGSGECDGGKPYNIPNNTPHNVIPVLSFGDKRDQIKNKINTFCTIKDNDREMEKLKEQWKCYEEKDIKNDGQDYQEYEREVTGSGGICILEKTKGEENGKKQKTFNDFFYFWIRRFLNDSIEWREKLGKCLENGSKIKCGNKKCEKFCKCYESWVEEKKEKEWKPIKEHFGKQGGFGEGAGEELPHYMILESVLEEYYFKNIQEAYGDSRAIQGIKDTLAKKKNQVKDEDFSTTKTIIDYLLDHERGEAKTCLDTHKSDPCPKPPGPAGGGGAKSGEPLAPGTHVDTKKEDSEEEEEEEEEDEDVQGPAEEPPEDTDGEGKTATEDTERPKQEASPSQNDVNVCNIVKDALKLDNLTKACDQKYGYPQRHWGWKCIPSDTKSVATSDGVTATDGEAKIRQRRDTDSAVTPTSGSSGAICVPPRRRRLYVGKLEEWANSGNTQEGGDKDTQASVSPGKGAASSQAPNGDSLLRDAFIQSAAIETFFLWHKYKMEKKREDIERKERENELFVDKSSEPDKLDKKLKEGNIPEDFKRQMFYTLGDYRDILYSGSNDTTSGSNNNNIVLEASGNTEEGKKDMKEILEKIQAHINSGSTPPGEKTPQQTWWKKYGPDIWEGMVCALTYKDNSETGPKGTDGTNKIEKDNEVYNKFFGENSESKDKLTPVTNGTYKEKYDYKIVTISSVGPSGGVNTTNLENFACRPTYFRWLEEWGEEFCRKQKHKLYIIEKDCRGKDGNNKVCSGDGLNCKDTVPDKKDIFKPFNCHSCANSCRYYKKWIKKKKDEFEEQKKAYKQQQKKCKEESNCAQSNKDSNGVCATLTTYNDAEAFLNRLKNGPCSKNNSGEDNKGKGYIDFENEGEAFGHQNYCDPCSKFKVECNGNDKCSGGDTKVTCIGTTVITVDNFNNKTDSTNVDMLVSDNSPNGNKFDGLQACQHAGIFKGIKENKWECGKFCGYDVCTLEKKDTNGQVKEHIIMKEFLKRWLENFFEDYNTIQKKLKACTKSGKGSPCICGCKKKCDCVEKWIEKKQEEWQNINSTYLEKYTEKYDDGNNLKTFLEDGPFKNEVDKAIKPCNNLQQFQESKECAVTENAGNGKPEKKDVVLCLLENLKTKATSCQSKHSDKTEQQCQKPPLVEDDEEDLLLEDENTEEAKKNMMPTICKGVVQEPVEDKDGCEPASPAPQPPAGPAAGGKENPEQTPILKPEEEEPAPEARPKVPEPTKKEEKKVTKPKGRQKAPPNPWEHPIVIPSLATSTLMWTVGIGFATFTYFYLKVLYICGCVFLCGYVFVRCVWIYIYVDV